MRSRTVLPLVPSTMAWYFARRGMAWPTLVMVNSGVSVSPWTSIRSSRPPNVPFADRMPEMPLNTLRSASSKVNVPSSGVSPGSSLDQGPNDPWVTISPGGTPLVSVASNGIARSKVDRLHVQVVNRPHLRLLPLPARDDHELRVGADQVVDDKRGLPTAAVGRVGLVGLVRRFVIVAFQRIGGAARRDLNVEAFERDGRDMPAENTEDTSLDGELFDRDEWRHVLATFVPDCQSLAFGTERRQHPEIQAVELDLAVEVAGEYRDDLHARCLGPERND